MRAHSAVAATSPAALPGSSPEAVATWLDQLAATTQYLVQGSLQQYLGDLIQVDAVDVTSEDSTLRVSVRYLVRQTQTLQTAEFTKGVATA